MSVFDPTFLKFDGTPETGRVPTTLTVVGRQRLSASQLEGVQRTYDAFNTKRRTTNHQFHVDRSTLPDGTKVHIWSLQNRTEIVVVLPPTDDERILPHGFVVVTNWNAPKFYCRDTNSGVNWRLGADEVEQVDSVSSTIFDSQVFRKSGADYFNLPHVYNRTTKALWDYDVSSGLLTPTTQINVPFRTKNFTTGELTFEPPHYIAGNKIIDADGAECYVMADSATILAPSSPYYPDVARYLPGSADAEGNQVAMAAWRFATLSESSNIWKFRFWNERIKRVGDAAYELLERSVVDIITPWPKQTGTTVDVNDSAMGEDPAAYFKYKPTFVLLPGAYTGGGSGRLYYIGWAGPEQWVDISGVALSSNTSQVLREITEQVGGTSTISKVMTAPTESAIGHIDIDSELNYPATVLWRGGTGSKRYNTTALEAFLGYGLGYNYRVDHVTISRYDTKYDVDGTPTITAKLGWKNLKLLEGSTTGRMSGKEYTNQFNQIGTYPHIDSTWSYTWITKEIKHSSDFPFHPYNQYFLDWMDAANVKDEYYDDYLEYGTLPHGSNPAPNPYTKYEYPHNDRPENTAEYSLVSRYVIDYDHKGRFYAAIRCEVACSGALWKENLAVYKGYMQKETDPSYSVKIWFESNWNGVAAQQLLVEESVTRPMFEAITISKFNPWYWPYIAYIDRDCKVRTPPEPVPDESFMMMFQNLASHQGANTNLCCEDARPDITGGDVALTRSTDGIEYSYLDGGTVTPHTKYVTGQLYARTFKLSDIMESLWMLKQLKCGTVEDDFQPIDGPEKPTWFYHPIIKAALNVQRHIEVRDGVIVQWSDNVPGVVSGYPPTEAEKPAPTSRTIKLYRV